MNIFQVVKNSINMFELASYYGILPKRSGFTNCIFHNDNHPSMKIYKDHYHCFACGAHGDVIGFVAKLFGLRQFQAAKKIAEDFELTDTGNSFKGVPASRKPIFTPDKVCKILSEYISLLENNKTKYPPVIPGEEFHPLYVESLNKLPQYKYYLDYFINGNSSEQQEFIKTERRLLYELETRLRQSTMAI